MQFPIWDPFNAEYYIFGIFSERWFIVTVTKMVSVIILLIIVVLERWKKYGSSLCIYRYLPTLKIPTHSHRIISTINRRIYKILQIGIRDIQIRYDCSRNCVPSMSLRFEHIKVSTRTEVYTFKFGLESTTKSKSSLWQLNTRWQSALYFLYFVR